jgi:secretion/DNA translocation related TadE-like protein
VSGERGSASLVAVAIVAMATVLALGAADLAEVLIAESRAQTAADAAALAAAQELAIPSGRDPAEVAAEYVARNDGDLLECSCARGAFEATVRVRLDAGTLFLLGEARAVEAEARAVVDMGPPA